MELSSVSFPEASLVKWNGRRDHSNIIYSGGKYNEIKCGNNLSNGEVVIKDYLTQEPLSQFPDIARISKVIGGAKNLQKYWNGKERGDRIEILEQSGQALANTDTYDELISRAGGFPIKYVTEARKGMGQYFGLSEELLARGPGKGPVFAATSITAPIIPMYITAESLFGNCSVLIKGDTEEPFSSYLLPELSISEGLELPVQFITYNRNGTKSEFATEIYRDLCNSKTNGSLVFMGHPETAIRIAYGPKNVEIFSKSGINISELPMPANMLAFTSHGGAMIVDESADVDEAVNGAVESFKFPKACKAPTGIFVYETAVEEFTDKLKDVVSRQKVGDVANIQTDIAQVSEKYWARVDDFLRVAKSNGQIVYGGELNVPTIIVGQFNNSLYMEPGFPVYCIESYSNLEVPLEKINSMGSKMPKGKILDLSVYSGDEFFRKIVELRTKNLLNAYTLHPNSSTMDMTQFTPHEEHILRKSLAQGPFHAKA